MTFTFRDFSRTAKSWSAAILTTAFMISNANAADFAKLNVIEPNATDLSKPLEVLVLKPPLDNLD